MTRQEALNKILETLFDNRLNKYADQAEELLHQIEKFMVPQPVKVVVGKHNGQDFINTINKWSEEDTEIIGKV